MKSDKRIGSGHPLSHCPSTSVVLNSDGTLHSQARHYPYGAERWSSGTLPTDYRFTGQREESHLGLYHMGARFYDPALGRWLSADTIVPEPGEPQAFNRYSFVVGNPLKYVDPTGHSPEGECDNYSSCDGSGDDVNWTHPAVEEYYYELYMDNPDLYLQVIMLNSEDPTILAAMRHAEKTGQDLAPLGEDTDLIVRRKRNAIVHVALWDAVDQLGPDDDFLVQLILAYRRADQLGDALAERGRRNVEGYMLAAGSPPGLATTAGWAEEQLVKVQKDTGLIPATALYVLAYPMASATKQGLKLLVLLSLQDSDLIIVYSYYLDSTSDRD